MLLQTGLFSWLPATPSWGINSESALPCSRPHAAAAASSSLLFFFFLVLLSPPRNAPLVHPPTPSCAFGASYADLLPLTLAHVCLCVDRMCVHRMRSCLCWDPHSLPCPLSLLLCSQQAHQSEGSSCGPRHNTIDPSGHGQDGRNRDHLGWAPWVSRRQVHSSGRVRGRCAVRGLWGRFRSDPSSWVRDQRGRAPRQALTSSDSFCDST